MATLSGIASFLNNGQANPMVTTGSETTSQLPTWYTQYANDILNKTAQYANQAAPVFPGPQVAPQTQDTLSSYAQMRDLAGTYGGLAAQGAGVVGNMTNQIEGGGALSTASPYISQSANVTNAAIAGANPLGAASPYLNAAAAGAAPNINNYLNPYVNDVVKNIATSGTENLQNNLLPALQAAFTSSGGGGHYGGAPGTNNTVGNTQEGFQEQMLGRNVAQDIGRQQEAAMQSGYGQALSAAQQQAALESQLAGTAGGLSASGTGLRMQGAGQLGNLGGVTGNLAATNIGQGLQAGQGLGSLGAIGANTGLGIAGGLNSAGQQQQQQTQNNLNTAMQNWQTQFNWPVTGAGAMESALQGIQVPTLNTAYQTGPMNQGAYQTSPLGTIGGVLQNSGALGALGDYFGSLFGGGGGAGSAPSSSVLPDLTGMVGMPNLNVPAPII